MAASERTKVNNELYHQLGERWYNADDDPVALLRAEARTKNPWIIDQLLHHLNFAPSPTPSNISSATAVVAQRELATRKKGFSLLDIGCGAGFLTNQLSDAGFQVTGLDMSAESLAVAQAHDRSGGVNYQQGDAYHLPFDDESFDSVSALDFLEHVDDPQQVVAEASRVLKRQGLFFFHTFNRNLLSWLVVIKGVEWFVRNTPPHLHVYHLFIKPAELVRYCQNSGLEVIEMVGLRPKLNVAFFRLLVNHVVPKDFQFTITRSLTIGYLGLAKKV